MIKALRYWFMPIELKIRIEKITMVLEKKYVGRYLSYFERQTMSWKDFI